MAAKGPREIWFNTTRKGTRTAWYYSYPAMRAIRLPLIDAEYEILTGAAVETTKPMFVGK